MKSFNGNSAIFHYYSNLSGKVTIIPIGTEIEIEIDGQDVLDLVAEIVRSKKIGDIEDMETNEILGL